MKLVYPELAAHLVQETTSLCRLLKIVRLDGIIVRLTDFDRDLFYADMGVTRWLPFGPAAPASPWWILNNDAFTFNVFAGPGGASGIAYIPATTPWGISQMFSGNGSSGNADFLGTPFCIKDYVFESVVSLHADTTGAHGGIRIGAGTGVNWTGTDKYIGFSALKTGSAWGNWQLRMSDGVTATTTDSGVPVGDTVAVGSAGGVRTKLKAAVNADGSAVAWYINGLLISIVTTNIPIVPLALCNHFESTSFTGSIYYRVESLALTARTQQGGGTYESEDGMTFSALEQKSDGSPNNLQVTGFLDVITEHDIRARVYDGGTFELRTVNWSDLTQGDLKILSGTIGDVTMKNGQFQMELRGLTQKLTTMMGAKYGPICRAELFGGGVEGIDPNNHFKCRLSRATWVQTGTVTSNADPLTIVPSALLMVGSATPSTAAPAGWFDSGVIKFTSGALTGFSFEIGTWDGTTLYLFGGCPLPFAPAVSDTFEIEPGCPKIISVCKSKFNNVINFAGEPNIPGINVLSVIGRPQVQTR